MNLNNWQTQLRKGLLDIVILNLLRHGERHGYEMVQSLKVIQGLKIREGNIYPILARLQTDGLVTSYSQPSQDGPPRKYFKLTELGQRTLVDMNAHWDQIIESIQSDLGLTFSVEIARQGGKNELSAHLEVLLLTMFMAAGGNAIKCSPTFKPQTIISMSRLKRPLLIK